MLFSCFARGIDPTQFGYHAIGGQLHWGYYCDNVACMSMGFHPMVAFQDIAEVIDFMDAQAVQSKGFRNYIERVKQAHEGDKLMEDWTKGIDLEGL